MKIISHRGNLYGPEPSIENSPLYIQEALKEGFDVELDLWFVKNNFYLGHDEPTYLINENFFNDRMWIHCKNLEVVEEISKKNLNWFWHDKDKMTITSKGNIWCNSHIFVKNGITVECGKYFEINHNILGICTDYPIDWRNNKNEK